MRFADPKLQIRIILLLSLAGLSAALMAVTAVAAFGRAAASSRETARSVGAQLDEQIAHTAALNDLQGIVTAALGAGDAAALDAVGARLDELRAAPRFAEFANGYDDAIGELIGLRRSGIALRSDARRDWARLQADMVEVNRALAETVDNVEFQSLIAAEGAADSVAMDDSLELSAAAWRIRTTLHGLESTVQSALLSDSPALLDMAEAEAGVLRRLLERDYARLLAGIAPEFRGAVEFSEAKLRGAAERIEAFLAMERNARAAEARLAEQAQTLTGDLLAWHARIGGELAQGADRATERLVQAHESMVHSRNLLILVACVLILITLIVNHTVHRAVGRYVRFRQNAELELAQRNRTIETARAILEEQADQLKSLVAEAQAASMAKSQFVANMSHEIRTPLNGVIGMTELLGASPLAGEQRECVDAIRRSGEALLATVNEILDFSKLEAGKLDLEVIPFRPRETAEAVGAILAAPAHEKGLELVVSAAPDVPEILRGDPHRFRQVLLNLAGNAVKFTEAGEVAIRLSRLPDDVDSGAAPERGPVVTLLCEVTDTGIGLSPAQQEAIFKPFSQADASTTRRYGGTGLGLAIARSLVEAMNGSIGVASDLGNGACFWFTAEFQPALTDDESHCFVPWIPLRGRRVLVVDDGESNRRVLHECLAHWSMRPNDARSADEALDLLQLAADADPYDAVIIDADLAGMSGLDFSRFLQRQERWKALPRILLTQAGAVPPADVLAAAGVAEHLPKPVRQSALFEALQRILTQGGAAAPAEEKTGRNDFSHAAAARILLVDDVVINQKVAAKLLQRLGLRCDTASDGREAVDKHAAAPYDIIFMDCQMPNLDGFEAARIIRRHENQGRRTPIIALTAMALAEDRERCKEAGMDGYIAKPVTEAALARVLTDYLPAAGAAPVA